MSTDHQAAHYADIMTYKDTNWYNNGEYANRDGTIDPIPDTELARYVADEYRYGFPVPVANQQMFAAVYATRIKQAVAAARAARAASDIQRVVRSELI
ncbi:hypothetical protein F8271_23400 [Micromonospora sp. ALFpr18c]|uniref:hypothetical protein n=1 Tax=Micromonospora sp. ALFpr18c TaxID=1458665 RepID=UPI00124B771F|nr:hypothetical protein [Micromonospora sp. ALFpr18c]KAB1934435.1 hypothetical protein F8271_23400 [Micromonospora sp. ALFpr18c]